MQVIYQKLSRRDLDKAIESNDLDAVRNMVKYHDPANDECLKLHQKRFCESVLVTLLGCRNDKICWILVDYLKKYFSNFGAEKKIIQLLKSAIQFGNVQVTELLLQNINDINSLKGSPWNNLDLLARILFDRKNADVRTEILKLLLDHGMKVTNMRNSKGHNILHKYCISPESMKDQPQTARETAEILIEHDQNLTHQADKRGWKPVHWSIYGRRTNLGLFIFRKNDGYVKKDIKLLRDLLEKTLPGINASLGNLQQSALHVCCQNHKKNSIRLYLDRGADVNKVDADGATPFSLLNPEKKGYDESLRVMLREFARLTYENLPVPKTDMEFVRANDEMHNYFEQCLSELSLMSSTVFYEPFSYYFVLRMSKSVKKLSGLTKNNDFLIKFEENLALFELYASDLREIFHRAVDENNKSLVVESSLSRIFGEYLPKVVIRKVAGNLSIYDLPSE